MKNKIGIWLTILALGVVSCTDWLDVRPKELVEDEDLFSREIGFKEALTGIYLKMTGTSLYGGTMTYRFMDILAQNYRPGSPNYQDQNYYVFPSSVTGAASGIWSNMYNLIADINNLLYWTDKNSTVLTTKDYYEVIKGEALGLRGFLHFDLLRTHGPVYKERPNASSICYRSAFNLENKSLLPANVVADSIIRDLKEAEALLTNHDPLNFSFSGGESMDRFMSYRYNRFNLYAVKATLARVYMYLGKTREAMEYAQQVIGFSQFKFVFDNTADRMLSTELIFAVHMYNTSGVFDAFSENGSYRIADRNYYNLLMSVDRDGGNDLRLREGVGFSTFDAGKVCLKYMQSGLLSGTEGSIPLIRLPEMYMILAEGSNDMEESAFYLNKIRDARGLDLVTYTGEEEKMDAITREFRKEFYAEGQTFFFYKRNFFRTFAGCPVAEMQMSNYIFDIPEDEYVYGGITE